MKINAKSEFAKSELKGLSIIFLYKDILQSWNNELKNDEFKGKIKEYCYVANKDAKYFFVGLGDKQELDLAKFSEIIAFAVKKISLFKKENLNFVLPKMNFSDVDCGKTLIESINLALYNFCKYKTIKEIYEIKELNVFLDGFTKSRINSFERGIELGNLFSIAVNYARDLVNEPPSTLNPTYLSEEAIKIAKQNTNIETTIFDAKKMKKIGMQASLDIGKGSIEEPKFIKLEYRPKRAFNKIILVGKGLTFDSGGLSIKTSEGMETMKIDMAGAAAVLAVFKVVEKLKINVHLIGLISAVENMPSGSSIRPGDVTRAFNGKTIEVLNTDAEGRVTLADSLSFAASLKPKYIIDMATLTGACMIALGEEISGIMGNNRELISQIFEAGKIENEKNWELPLENRYKEMLKSNIADIKNTAKRYGGAITAGLFLQEFVDKTPWIHMDIAGPAYYEKDTDLVPKGASGIPVKTILRFLMNVK